MKKLKVTIGKAGKTRSFDSLPEKEKTTQRFKRVKKMACPCCDGTMILENEVWLCQDCAFCITQKDMIQGDATFWFCDECGRFINVQPGFTEKTGAWKCIACGWVNDVSEENIID